MTERRWIVAEAEQGERLDRWLAALERLGSRSRALAALERGKIFLEDAEQDVRSAGLRLHAGAAIRYWEDRPGSSRRRYLPNRRVAGLDLVHEDETILIVAKPAGLLTIPRDSHPGESSVVARLQRYLEGRRAPHIVHRIDRDTTGLVVVAKTEMAARDLRAQFARREPERCYWAVVEGCPEPEAGTWEDRLAADEATLRQRAARKADEQANRARTAISHYRVLERLTGAALLEVRLETGKRNQIRVQAALRGHPLVGERQYRFGRDPEPTIPFPRQALHAYRLSFNHPLEGRSVSFEAPLPRDFSDLLSRLRTKGHPPRRP